MAVVVKIDSLHNNIPPVIVINGKTYKTYK